MLLALTLLALLPTNAVAQSRVQRFTLIIGANLGGADRPRLQYAITDAERVARVMVELGGVDPANEIVLKQPRLSEMVGGARPLAAPCQRRASDGGGGGRTEVLLYYSGHADEQGLLLGDDRYSYRTLRDRLDRNSRRRADCGARRVRIGRLHPDQERQAASCVPRRSNRRRCAATRS